MTTVQAAFLAVIPCLLLFLLMRWQIGRKIRDIDAILRRIEEKFK